MNNIYFIEDNSSLDALLPYLRSGDSVVHYRNPGRRDIAYVKELSPSELGKPMDCDYGIISVYSLEDISYLYTHLDLFKGNRNRISLLASSEEVLRLLYSLDIPFSISPDVVHNFPPSFDILKKLCRSRHSTKAINPFSDMIKSILENDYLIPNQFTLRNKGEVYFLDRHLGHISLGDVVLKERIVLNPDCSICEYQKHCPSRISPKGCVLRAYSFPFLFDFLSKVKIPQNTKNIAEATS